MAERPPDLPAERRDRRLAARTGNGDDLFGLSGVERRRGMCQRQADIVDQNERRISNGFGRLALGDDRLCAFGDRLRDEGVPVRFCPGNREKGEPRFDAAAVGGEAGELGRSKGCGA